MGEKITRSDVNIKYIFINPNENIVYTNNSAHNNSGSIQSTRQTLQTISNKRTKYDNNKTTTHTTHTNTNDSKHENNTHTNPNNTTTTNTASSNVHTETHTHKQHHQELQQQQHQHHQQAQDQLQLQLQQEINTLKTRIQIYETNEHILHTNITSLNTDLNLTKTVLKNGLATSNNPPSNLQVKLDKIEQSNHHLSEAISLLTKQLSDRDNTIHHLTNTLDTYKTEQKRVSDQLESSKNQHCTLQNELNNQKLLYIQYKTTIEQNIINLNNEIITYK